jgi:hypothetical protein
MSQYNQNNYRGLLVPDPNVNATTLNTTGATQAGNAAGVPEPQGDTDLNLEATGTQSAGKDLRIKTQVGGHGGRGRASFIWKNNADAGTAYRGWDPPSALSAWQSVEWEVAAPVNDSEDPHVIPLSNNTALLVYDVEEGSPGSTESVIRSRIISENGTISSAVEVYEATSVYHLHPCVLQLPSGRILCFYYIKDAVTNTMQIGISKSDDEGNTWAEVTKAALATAVDISGVTSAYDLALRPYAKLRAAYANGQVLLLAGASSNLTSTYRGRVLQFASDDLGYNFDLVSVSGGATLRIVQPEILADPSGFNVFFIGYDAGAGAYEVMRRSIGTAYDPINGAPDLDNPDSLTAGNFSPISTSSFVTLDADLAVCRDADGAGYVFVRGKQTSGTGASSELDQIRVGVNRAGFYGITGDVEPMGQGTRATDAGSGNIGNVWNGNSTANKWLRPSACYLGGRIIMAHSWTNSTSTSDDEGLGLAYLGGYTQKTLPEFDQGGNAARRLTWDRTWVPIELPNNMGWTALVTGGPVVDLNAGYVQITTTADRQLYKYVLPGNTATTEIIDGGIVAHWAFEFVSHTLSADAVRVDIDLEQAAASYGLRVYLDASTITAYDIQASAVRGTASVTGTTPGVECLAYFKDNKASVYVRPRDFAKDKAWITVCENATMTDGGAVGSPDPRIIFGNGPSSTAVSKWYWLNWSSLTYACGAPYAGTAFVNPTDLKGRPYGSLSGVYVDDSVLIKTTDGPTVSGDEFSISTKYAYAASNLVPSVEPSPNVGWRSTQVASAEALQWDITSPPAYSTLGIVLRNANFRTATLYGWDASLGSPAWATIAAIDTATGQENLTFTRFQDSIFVAAGAPGSRYFELDELKDCTVELVGPNSSGLATTQRLKVSHNSAGIWDDVTGQQKPIIKVSGHAALTTPVSGAMRIYSKDFSVVVHNSGGYAKYTKFKLEIPAQGVAVGESYFSLGQVVIGGVFLFSTDYSWGRVIDTEPNTQLATFRNGSRRSKKLGENRRIVQFGWGEGVDTTPLNGTQITTAGDYVTGTTTSGAATVAIRGDMASTISELNRYTAGPNLPLVYFPAIPAGSSGNDTKSLQGRQGAGIYCRMIGGVSLDSIVGEELQADGGELIRIANVTLEEEL